MSICRPLLNQKHNMKWFLLRRFVDLLRIYFLLVISRNHSNRVKYYSKGYLFWYQDFGRFAQVVVHYLTSILMICKWTDGKILKIKDTFFTLNLWMTATRNPRVSLLRIFFVSLDKSVLFHRRCLMSKFREILILVCRKILRI